MQTLEEGEEEAEDKLANPPHPFPPPPSLPGLLCARLQIDSDVLIYVLMTGLVCSLCSVMLHVERKQDHRDVRGHSYTYAPNPRS